MKYLTFLLASLLLVGCTKIDDIHEVTVNMPIEYSVSGVDTSTKASLTTTDNVATKFPTMEVKAVKNNVAQFVTTFPTAKPSNPTNQYYWTDENSSCTFYSYPKGTIEDDMWLSNNIMSFNYTVSANSTDTPDIVVAASKPGKGNKVNFTYKHVFTAVNVIYGEVKIGHSITSIKIKDQLLTGKCRVSTSGVVWDNLSGTKTDLVDSKKRFITKNDTEVTEDGCKFMTIPGQQIKIEVVIDGKTITATSTADSYKAGDIVNFYINDDLTITQKEGTGSSGSITKNSDGTYKMTLESWVTGEYTTTTTTTSKPMDFILVLDYSSSMTNSYFDSKLSNYNAATVTKVTYNDWKSNKTKYKATFNGTQYTITCTNTKNNNSVGYTSDNIHWAYITVGSDRYYVTLDGGLHRAKSTAEPTSARFPVSTDGNIIYPSVGGYNYLFGAVTFASKKVNNRMVALQAAVSAFVDKVQTDAVTGGVEHRICIVDFQNPKFPSYTNQQSGRATYIQKTHANYLRQCYALQYDKSTNNNAYYDNKSTTGVLFPFRPVNALSVNSIKAAVSLPYTAGCTAIDYGMYLASLEMANCRGGDVGKCVIVFTDGKATHATDAILSDCVISGYNAANQKMSDSDVENGAKKYSKVCKDAGATVYTVSVFDGSDKPSSSFMETLASGADYYKDASSGSLSDVFATIATETVQGTATIDIHETAYVTTIISDAFKIPAGYKANVYFKTATQTGYNETTKVITWGTPETATGVYLEGIAYDTFKISGFDYGKYFCGKGANGKGKKLIMVFDNLPANPEREGTGSNQAIEFKTGLYDKDGNEITMFQPLYVNL